MGFDSRIKANLYYEHFPEALEKYGRFPKFSFLSSNSSVRSVLNYVPHKPACLTCLRALRAHVPYLPYVPACLRALPLTCLPLFACLTCQHFFKFLHFFTCLRFFTCLACLHFFKMFLIFDVPEVPSPLKIWNNPKPIAISFYKQEQEGLNKKEIQMNLYNIFSIFIFNELYLFA